jgi:hypothetical protein
MATPLLIKVCHYRQELATRQSVIRHNQSENDTSDEVIEKLVYKCENVVDGWGGWW